MWKCETSDFCSELTVLQQADVQQKFVKIVRVFGLKLFSFCFFSTSLAKLLDATTNRLLVFHPLINQVFWKHQ